MGDTSAPRAHCQREALPRAVASSAAAVTGGMTRAVRRPQAVRRA